MPIVALKLVPSVNAELTPALNEAGIAACNLIRFKSGLPEKLGGWTKYISQSLIGAPRALHAWEDLNGVTHLAAGTVGSGSTELSIITNGSTTQDITPLALTSNFTANFSTIGGSTTVTVNDSNIANVTTYDSIFLNTPVAVGGRILHGAYPIASVTGTSTYTFAMASAATATATATGSVPVFDTTANSAVVSVTLTAHAQAVNNRFTFPLSTTVAGATIDGTYTVNTVPNANSFTISANTQATATASGSMNGGRAQLVYTINLGPQATSAGYGLGGYGLGGYGTGVVPDAQNGSAIIASGWTLDNWGETILACPQNGGIYQWSPNNGFLNAGLIATAPPFNSGIFVSMPAQILVAYGSVASGEQQDPLIVRWSDQEDYTVWTAASTNQAGSFRIPRGSRIVGGLQGPQQSLLWTDLALWAMVYQGPGDFVFGFNEIMSGCGLIGQHAATVMRGSVYWMGTGNFFALGAGGLQSIPCSVWDVVFQDLDTANQDKCVAAANSAYDEIVFYYPSLSGGSGEVDAYVKFNIEEKSWDYGRLARTAWVDQSVLGEPIGTSPQGVIYQHETSPDADGQALAATFTTGWFTIAEGQDMSFVDWFFPDMKWKYFNGTGSASVQVTIEASDYPNQTARTYGPFTMTDAKSYVNCRLRGRLIRLTYASSDVGTWWRLGNQRYRVSRDGRR